MEVPETKPRKDDEVNQLKPSALWYRPPVIVPNYGARRKRNSVLPKSKIQHVLLHDNKNQKNMLDSNVKYMTNDFKRSSRLSDLHKRSFLVRQSMKQVGLWQKGIDHVQILPEVVVQLHCPGNSKNEAMQSSEARRQAVMKAQLQAMFPDDEEDSKTLGRPEDTLQMLRGYTQTAGKNRRYSRQASTRSMSDFNQVRLQSEAGEIPSRLGQTREKTTVSTTGGIPQSGTQSMNTAQSYVYNRSKTAMPKMQPGLTRKFSTYNMMPRRELTAAGKTSTVYHKAADDPRFKGLKKQLIAPEKPIDGFIQLSPCGPKVIQKYGCSHYDPHELTELLGKYNDVSYISPGKLRNEQRKEERGKHLLPVRQAFVQNNDEGDRDSLYSSGDRSSTDSVLLELH